jgi:Cu(I)/Ag(I) efflux system periplasmic protein CusF
MKNFLGALALTALAATAGAQTPQASGEVTKIDKANGRITLRHGEIKHLDMPPMTMNFRVRDSKVLDGVAVGDRIRFTAEKVDGSYVLTGISKGS